MLYVDADQLNEICTQLMILARMAKDADGRRVYVKLPYWPENFPPADDDAGAIQVIRERYMDHDKISACVLGALQAMTGHTFMSNDTREITMDWIARSAEKTAT